MTFLVAFIVSFFGSIPPGAINLSVLQMGLEGRTHAAIRFTLAAALIEIPYAIIAIKFQELLEQTPVITENFTLIAAIVLLILGCTNLIISWSNNEATGKRWATIRNSGFRKGILLGIFNPMAIPFWIGVTAYLKHSNWIELSSLTGQFAYISGLAIGTVTLLLLLVFLSKTLAPYFRRNELFQRIPGIVFILLGIYSLVKYLKWL